MVYTVKKLAAISGVSVRTLHWYDKIKLLKPASHGANGYRYYDENGLLRLQQILFFKELGFSLTSIKKLLSQNDFDNIEALKTHKQFLQAEVTRKNELINTINKTIQHMQGALQMQDQELYQGFDNADAVKQKLQKYEDQIVAQYGVDVLDLAKQKRQEYGDYMVAQFGEQAKNLMKPNYERAAEWSENDWAEMENLTRNVFKDLFDAIKENLDPEGDAVQAIMACYYQLIEQANSNSKEVFSGIANLYTHHPDFSFNKASGQDHSKAEEFIGKVGNFFSKAMKFYADHSL